MAYILGANNQTQAQKFVDHLARITNTSKGSSVVYPSRRVTNSSISTGGTSQVSSGVILGVLESENTIRVVSDSAGIYDTGSVITVSMLSAVYGSYATVGVNVVAFHAQVQGVGGSETL